MKSRKHHLIFLLMTLVSLFAWSQMILYLVHEISGYNLKWGLLQYCVNAIREQTILHQAVFVGLNIAIFYSFGVAFWIIAQQILQANKWNRFVLLHQDQHLTEQTSRTFQLMGFPIVVIRHQGLLAVTSGFLRPRIIISSELVERFSERELKAILWHERSHCRQLDPLRILMVTMMRKSLPFIPILKQWARFVEVSVELQADQYAVRRMNSAYELASVLLKCSNTFSKVSASVGFADQAINYRLKQLIDPKTTFRIPLLETIPFMFSALIMMLLASIVTSGCS